jgi:hypothetical protein
MQTYEFVLRVDREVTGDEIEALYEAGLSDAAVETGPLGTLLDFSREAESRDAAVTSAITDVRKVPGLDPVLETSAFNPDWCVAPAATLDDYLTENSLTVNQLAVKAGGRGRPQAGFGVAAEIGACAAAFREVLNREPLTETHITVLAAATGTSEAFWRNYEHDYRTGLASGRKDVTHTPVNE